MAGENSIRKDVLADVLKDWQVEITVDLFPARNNAKHKRYYTLGKDWKAEGRDSMRISWEEEGESLRNNDSTMLAWVGLVDIVIGNNSERDGIGRKREGIGDGIEDQEEESESLSGEDISFRGKQGQDGARLFRNALEASGFSRNAIRSIIGDWHGSWRKHVCVLSAIWKYLRRRGISEGQLTRIDKPYIIIAEYITNILKDLSEAFVMQARTSVSTIFKYEESYQRSDNLENGVATRLHCEAEGIKR
ncbi:MAG: hypothetical protein EZS28_003300 [Streblomastix strix]|uniref:Uncharacterized protein n=1 Tax=Streblomastix strix TaxID=222440 RepID=A0A5J4X2E8_9EUKA|nr:MAG: hypothetical protein EZS28_003300 [Streblomastix strix]